MGEVVRMLPKNRIGGEKMPRKTGARKDKPEKMANLSSQNLAFTAKYRELVLSIMKEKDWNLSRLAEETGIDRSRLTKILIGEKGEPPLRLHEDHVVKICKTLGIIVKFGYKREIKSELAWL